jgi:exodeoxyribonuclease-3
MRIATWNVNSVRQRLDHLLTWLKDCSPDIVCLQEIKCVDEAFPREAIEALGYNVVTHGQKTFNGVALLSKFPLEEATPRLAGDDDDVHARFLEGVVSLKKGVVRVACLYLPNGNHHLLLSPQASDRLVDVGIDSYVRAWEKPSDHVPVWIDLDLETA